MFAIVISVNFQSFREKAHMLILLFLLFSMVWDATPFSIYRF